MFSRKNITNKALWQLIGLSEVKNDIKNVINDVTNIVQIDENLVCEAFSDFEFLTHEKACTCKTDTS